MAHERLTELLHAAPCVRIVTHEEAEAVDAAYRAALALDMDVKKWSSVVGVRAGTFSDEPLVPATSRAELALCAWIGEVSSAYADARRVMYITFDLTPHLNEPVPLRAWRELVELLREKGGRLVMIDHAADAPPTAAPFEIPLPDAAEIESIVMATLRNINRTRPLDLKMTRGTLGAIVKNLGGLSRRHVREIIAEVVAGDARFDAEDLNRVLAAKRRVIKTAGLLEFVETPATLDGVGGLGRLKEWLRRRRLAFSPEAAAMGLTPPRGVLLLGVQGAGKSLCAKAIASAWQRPLLRMDPGALYDRYVGESERRLRDALAQAEAMAPVVLWIDEIEKAFASAASRSTDGGLSQRMFGTLLTWMQEHRAPVFLVATANDIEALPPELLRKGRFDEIFFVDLPGAEARGAILQIHLRKRSLDPATFDLPALVAATSGYSGAEIEQGIISAVSVAFAERSDGGAGTVTTQTLLHALQESKPLSVTMAEKIAGLRQWAQGRCVPAE
jgi:SpoVK/Ycf46/Vps4 family AAA+-type ATPase